MHQIDVESKLARGVIPDIVGNKAACRATARQSTRVKYKHKSILDHFITLYPTHIG